MQETPSSCSSTSRDHTLVNILVTGSGRKLFTWPCLLYTLICTLPFSLLFSSSPFKLNYCTVNSACSVAWADTAVVSENEEEQRCDFQQHYHKLTLFPTPLFDRDGAFHTEYNRAVTLKVNLNTWWYSSGFSRFGGDVCGLRGVGTFLCQRREREERVNLHM